MNQILYENRCRCNEEFLTTKKRKLINRSEGKPLQYPKSNEIIMKTFRLKYNKKLSPIAITILNSFQNKYIYYAIDDILYSLKSDLDEQENLLAILYSPILSLHNNFSINFFDIWIHDIYIERQLKVNKFLPINYQTSSQQSYITIKLFYTTRVPVKKQESLW